MRSCRSAGTPLPSSVKRKAWLALAASAIVMGATARARVSATFVLANHHTSRSASARPAARAPRSIAAERQRDHLRA